MTEVKALRSMRTLQVQDAAEVLGIKAEVLKLEDPFYQTLKLVKRSIKNQLVTYFQSQTTFFMREVEITSMNKKTYEYRKGVLESQLEKKMSELDRIFSEFVVVEPHVIHYGSLEYGNFHVCTYGEMDWFRNAVWIHEHVLEEFIKTNIPSGYPVTKDFECYKRLLAQLIHRAEIQSKVV